MYENGEYHLPMDEKSRLVRLVDKVFTYCSKPAFCKEYTQVLPYIDNLVEMISTDPEKEERLGLGYFVNAFGKMMIKEYDIATGKETFIPNQAQIELLYKSIKQKNNDISQSLTRSISEEELKKLSQNEATWIRLLRAMLKDNFNSIISVAKDPKYTNELIELKKETKDYLRNDFIDRKLTKEEYDGLRTTYYKIFFDEVKSVYDYKKIELPEPVKKYFARKNSGSPRETLQFMPENESVKIRAVNIPEISLENETTEPETKYTDVVYEKPNHEPVLETKVENEVISTSEKKEKTIEQKISVPGINFYTVKDLLDIARDPENKTKAYIVIEIKPQGE